MNIGYRLNFTCIQVVLAVVVSEECTMRQEILIKKIIGTTGTFLPVLRGAEGQLTKDTYVIILFGRYKQLAA